MRRETRSVAAVMCAGLAVVLSASPASAQTLGWYGAGGSCLDPGYAVTAYAPAPSTAYVALQTCTQPLNGDLLQAQSHVVGYNAAFSVAAANYWVNRTGLSEQRTTTVNANSERNYFGSVASVTCSSATPETRFVANGEKCVAGFPHYICVV